MSDIVIKAEHLSKYYKLGTINSGTLRGDLQSWFARAFGKEDPNSKIGSDRFASTEDGFWALKDLNFDIKQGDRVGIIGKNGAGKSTLLKVLSRITAPTEGDVKIRGRVASLLEVGTGFHAELTGRENIYLNGAILGMKRREVTKKLDEIIAFSEIEKYIDTPVKRYSSGMYVRLAFAVAAHLDSEILIADEVLAVGDAAFQKKALGKMNELSTGQGRTVLFVSHNIPMVNQLCNKGIFIQQGSLMLDSDIESVVDKYLYGDDNKAIDSTSKFDPIYIEDLDATVTNIEILKEAETGKEFSLKIEVNSNIETENVGVQVMFSDMTGKRLMSFNTINTDNVYTEFKKGKNVFIFSINELLLAEGTYYLGVGFDKPNVIWYWQNEYFMRLSIKESYFDENRKLSNDPGYGITYAHAQWKVEQ